MLGYVEAEFIIYNAQSLKDKRAVLQKVMKRVKNKFNVSIAEIDHQNVWQRTKLGIACISSNRKVTEQELDEVLKLIDSFPELERTLTTFDWV